MANRIHHSAICLRQTVERAGAIGESLLLHAERLEHGDEHVRHGCFGVTLEVLVVLQPQLAPSCQKERVVRILMGLAIAAPVQNQRAIEEVALALGRLLQPRQEARQILGEKLVKATEVFRSTLLASTVGEPVPVAFEAEAGGKGASA